MRVGGPVVLFLISFSPTRAFVLPAWSWMGSQVQRSCALLRQETGTELVCSQGTVGGIVTIAQASSSGMGEIQSLGGRYKPGFLSYR